MDMSFEGKQNTRIHTVERRAGWKEELVQAYNSALSPPALFKDSSRSRRTSIIQPPAKFPEDRFATGDPLTPTWSSISSERPKTAKNQNGKQDEKKKSRNCKNSAVFVAV
jgi:hypothetical protein